MGLSIEVGYYEATGTEFGGVEPEELVALNEVLAAEGLPQHHEPPRLPPLQSRAACSSFPYSYLHQLRRLAAHQMEDPSWRVTPVHGDLTPADERLIERQTMHMTNHLLAHSDAEGFYVPVDFRAILFDEQDRIRGGTFGSSHQLMRDLVTLAPLLNIRLESGHLSDSEAERLNRAFDAEDDPFRIEKGVWIALYEAARLSLHHEAMIVFC
jgi:hypothetical protein